MQALRWVVAAFIILNAISGGLLAFRAVVLKRRARIDLGMPRVNVLLASLPWPLVGLWLGSMALFLTSALLLVLGEPAAVAAFVVALTLNLAVLWKAHTAIYGKDSSRGQLLTRCVLFGLLFLSFSGVWSAPSADSSHTARSKTSIHVQETSRL
jgi:hypothetical protein